MIKGYHPEVDDSTLCTEHDTVKYRSMMYCCIWISFLGILDIANATSEMIRFKKSTR
jgi:hypothetical protein